MKKSPALVAAIALATLGGCEKTSCLEQGYDITVRLIRDFNEGRCKVVFDRDQRTFDCPTGNLVGEINGRIFSLHMDTPYLSYDLDREAFKMQCATESVEFMDIETLRILERRFKEALAQLEVD